MKRADVIPSALLSFSYLPAAIATAAAATTTASAVAAAAAAITPAAATTTASATRSAATAALARTRFVDADIPPLEFRVVKFLDRSGGIIGIRHFHESEPSRLPRELVDYHYGAINFAGLGEQSLEILIGNRVG
jgi:hypothetical protein